MIERDMEDLIAAHPDDFFPRKKLVLIGRQQSFEGVGRFDLLFEDEFRSTLLMELKARTLKYDDATQVAKYRDELKRIGYRNVVMWLVAPQIPSSVREFLDDKGIQYDEIHVPDFRRVAERHNFVIASEVQAASSPKSIFVEVDSRKHSVANSRSHLGSAQSFVPTGPVVTTRPVLRWRAAGYDLILDNPECFDAGEFSKRLDEFASSVRSGKNQSLVNNLMRWAENPRYSRLTAATIESLLRWTITSTTWKAAVPFAYEVWRYLFGTPVPTWKQWNHSERKYEIDSEEWRRWFVSLTGNES